MGVRIIEPASTASTPTRGRVRVIEPAIGDGDGTKAKPWDLSGGQSRASIPRKDYYIDRTGNVRQNLNGDRGNPIVIPAQERAAYGKARERIDKLETPVKLPFGITMPAPSDTFSSQVARNTGAFDEIGYGADFALQGAGNLIRRAMGKPVDVPARVAGQARMDFEREQQGEYARRHPALNVLATGTGIALAGRPSGAGFTNPLAVGATAAAQNAPFAVARQEGSLPERLPGAARETALTFGLGSTFAAGANALRALAASAAARAPSPARQLANEGVTLTPGQMLGGGWQRTEDALTSVPVIGDAIRSARVRGIKSFNEAALSRALALINGGQAQTVGREGVKDVTKAIRGAYDRALTGVQVVPDQPFAQGVAAVAQSPRVPPALRGDLQSFVSDVQQRLAGPVDGNAWKAIDSDLSEAIRSADAGAATQASQRFLRDALVNLRREVGGLMERTNPAVYAAVRSADEATANLARIRSASAKVGTAANDGMFTPAQLNNAVRATDSSKGRAYGQGNALMQDLTDTAMKVLPLTVPDSGTPLRSLVSMGALGSGAVATGANPLAIAAGAGGVAAGSAVYSKPVQAMINAIYRASTPGQARVAFAALQAQAARNPSLGAVVDQVGRDTGLLPDASGGQRAPPKGQQLPTTP